MDTLFDACVDILMVLGDLTGLGYTGINVVIFCFIWPALFAVLIGRVIVLEKQVEHYAPGIHQARAARKRRRAVILATAIGSGAAFFLVVASLLIA